MAAYIATDAGYAGARDLVAAAGLITVGADGTISVSSFSGFFCCQIVLFPKKRKRGWKARPEDGYLSSSFSLMLSSASTKYGSKRRRAILAQFKQKIPSTR